MSTAIVEVAPAPKPTVGEIISHLQNKVSASRLNAFLQCRLKFFFHYVEGITKPKTAALHVGTVVHAVLKKWNKARWVGQPLILKELHDEFTRAWKDESEGAVKWENAEEQADEQKTAWRLVETYIRESKISPDTKPEAVEVSVETDLHQHGLPTLIGVLDLVQAGKIVDYKTSGQTPNAERVAHTTEVQTSIYSMLYRDAKQRRETGIELHHLVKTKNPKLVITATPPMSDRQQTRLFHLIEAYVHGLDVRDFVPKQECSASCVSSSTNAGVGAEIVSLHITNQGQLIFHGGLAFFKFNKRGKIT